MAAPEKDRGPFYVGLKEPVDIRRDLLTSSKTVIDALRRHEEFKLLRHEKMEYVRQFRAVLDETLLLSKKLHGLLPKPPGPPPNVPGVRLRKKEAPAPAAPASRPMPAPRKPAPSNRLEQLEDELARVESELQSLGG